MCVQEAVLFVSCLTVRFRVFFFVRTAVCYVGISSAERNIVQLIIFVRYPF